MEYLSAETLIELNKKMQKIDNKKPGVLSESKLHKTIEEINKAEDVYQGVANYLYKINQAHVFAGANKRTAYQAADLFAQINGYEFGLSEDKAIPLGLKIRAQQIPYSEVLDLVEKNTKKERVRVYG